MKSLIEESVCDVIKNHPSFFFNKKNVIGIGYGNKVKNKLDTNEPVIHVFVKEKLPINQLYPHEVIPQNFLGLKIDVIESGTITQDISVITIGKENSELLQEIRSRRRPIQGGISIGPANSKTFGTLGAVVFGLDDTPYILSAGHVLTRNGKNSKGSNIYQPSRANCYNNACGIFNDMIKKNVIAKLSKWTPLNYNENSFNYLDAGIAEINHNITFKNGIYHAGAITGSKDVELKEFIYKIGASTGYTVGRVLSLHNTIKIELSKGNSYTLAEQASSISFSKSGDSGSLVFNLYENALGLIVASSKTHTFFTPIKTILNTLNVYFDY